MAEAKKKKEPKLDGKILETAQPLDKKEERRAAVAIRYDVEKDRAPLIIASGRGPIAEEILRIAEDNQIPMYEDPEMAKLLSKLEMDTEIPPELYVVVAEVLFFVYKLDRMASKREKVYKKLKDEQQSNKDLNK